MQIGFVGLGRMGGNMVHRIRRDSSIEVVAFDPDPAAREAAAGHGAIAAASLDELVGKLAAPRAVWIMVPSGDVTASTIATLLELLRSGDTIIDGGNSNFDDTRHRSGECEAVGVHLVDAGTSGGVWGLDVGYCLMVGGPKAAVEQWMPVFTTLAPPDGFLHTGPAGSGNFVKMVHNGIEYGMLQAYAEGFAILEAQKKFGDLDLPAIAHLWNQGSVVRSWLLELAERALAADPHLEKLEGYVDDTGEGRWTSKVAIDLGVPAPVLTLSLMERFSSRDHNLFGNRVVAALRNEFGGHAVKSEETAGTRA